MHRFFDHSGYSSAAIAVPVGELLLHEAVLASGDELTWNRDAELELWMFHEFKLPTGKPDVIVAVVDPDALAVRIEAGIAPCTNLSAMYALHCMRSGVTPEAAMHESAVKPAMARLQRSGHLAVQGDEARPVDMAPLIVEAHAVEAKLGSSQAAIRQARGWAPYVDGVWLAFPSAYASALGEDNAALTRKGLLAIDEDGDLTVVRRPPSRVSRGAQSMVLAEMVFARYLNELAK